MSAAPWVPDDASQYSRSLSATSAAGQHTQHYARCKNGYLHAINVPRPQSPNPPLSSTHSTEEVYVQHIVMTSESKIHEETGRRSAVEIAAVDQRSELILLQSQHQREKEHREQLEKRCALLERELHEERTLNESKENTYSSEVTTMRSELALLDQKANHSQSQYREAAKQLEECQRQLRVCSDQLHGERRTRANAEAASLEAELARKEMERRWKESQHGSSSAASTIERLRADVKNLEEAKGQLEQETSKLVALIREKEGECNWGSAERERLQHRMNSLQDMCSKLQSEVTSLNEQNMADKRESEKQFYEAATLREELDRALEKTKRLQEELSSVLHEKHSLHKRLMGELEVAESTIHRDTNKKLMQDLQTLRAEKIVLEEKIAGHESESRRAGLSIERMRVEIEDLVAEKERIASELRQRTELNEQLNTRYVQLQEHVQQISSEKTKIIQVEQETHLKVRSDLHIVTQEKEHITNEFKLKSELYDQLNQRYMALHDHAQSLAAERITLEDRIAGYESDSRRTGLTIERMREEIEDLVAEKDRIASELRQRTELNEQLNTRYVQLQEHVQHISSEKTKIIQSEQETILKVRSELHIVTQEKEHIANEFKLKSELYDQLNQRYITLHDHAQSLSAERIKLLQSEQESSITKSSIERVKSELNSAHQEKERQARILRELEDALHAAQDDSQRASRELAQLRAAKAKADHENEDLRAQVHGLTAAEEAGRQGVTQRIARLEEELRNCEDDVKEKKSKLHRAQDEIRTLHSLLDQEKEACNALLVEKRELDLQRRQNEEEMLRMHEEHKTGDTKFQRMRSEHKELELKLNEVTMERDRIKAEMMAVQNEKTILQRSLAAHTEAHTSEVTKFTSERLSWQSERDDLKDKAAQAQNQLAIEREKFFSNYDSEKRKTINYEEEMKRKGAGYQEEINQMLNQLRQEKNTSQQYLGEKKALETEVESLRKTVAQLEHDKRVLLEQFAKDKGEFQAKLHSYDGLKEELRRVREQLTIKEDMHAKLDTQHSELIQDFLRLQSASHSPDREREHQELQQTVKELKLKLDEHKKLYQDEVNNQRRSSTIELNTASQQLSNENSRLRLELSQAHSDIQAREKELEAMQRELLEEGERRRTAEVRVSQQHHEVTTSRTVHHSAQERTERSGSLTTTGGAAPITTRPAIGVEIKAVDDADGNKDNVIQVYSVRPGGAAARAGIEPDDIIQLWNGQPVHSKAQFDKLVGSSQIGQIVTVRIYRKSTRAKYDIPVLVEHASKEKAPPRRVTTATVADSYRLGM